ncbi:ficolin-1-like [Zophobas morio]|uniref:ficolin-1-like n=1 Tax=Zophobas morio TaxID=2755281 RepID=UPI003082ECC5
MCGQPEFAFVLTLVFLLSTPGKCIEFTSVSTTQPPGTESEKIAELNSRLSTLETQIQKLLNNLNPSLPKNCIDVKENGNHVTGTYVISPKSTPFTVLCDMNTRNGGWVVFLNRFDGSQDFYLYWDNYKNGFGDFGGEFWLGLDHLHEVTGSEYNELLVELTDFNNKTVNAHYHTFRVGNEDESYILKLLDGFTGDAKDSLFYQKGMKFSTRDKDNDNYSGACATEYTGAWWYNSCLWSNLNGQYLRGQVKPEFNHKGMIWSTFHGSNYSLRKARMMVRPRK